MVMHYASPGGKFVVNVLLSKTCKISVDNRLLEYQSTETSFIESVSANSNSELAWLIRESSRFEEGGQKNIQDCLECDVDDPNYQVLSDDEIIVSVIDNQNPCDEQKEPSDNDRSEKGPTSEEAFRCPETAMRWFEQSEESDALQMLSLKRVRDLVEKKILTHAKEFFLLLFLNCRHTLTYYYFL
ncbi:hypothetical protein AVEN_52693-1 [Araneus ventricosus]|uniref:DDE-1 domain-containing protein n=1 Tax=Araneus ventricosus TaxID=182803 RepID=A0A4Y2EPN2_ARAVE|nr:hypothetical protein AVEN_52693-1 [Araneus ventricosus]